MKKGVIWLALIILATACGVDGDPGHCFFSLDWEFYSEDYRVSYYEDNNPDVPESSKIDSEIYYDCYPGTYDFYYESEDPEFLYSYTGYYTLYQNPGLPGGFLRDGPDGADTYLDLYLLVYAEEDDLIIIQQNSSEPEYSEKNTSKGLLKATGEKLTNDRFNTLQPIATRNFNHTSKKDGWTIEFVGTCTIYPKEY